MLYFNIVIFGFPLKDGDNMISAQSAAMSSNFPKNYTVNSKWQNIVLQAANAGWEYLKALSCFAKIHNYF
jgi:hypothetical protein